MKINILKDTSLTFKGLFYENKIKHFENLSNIQIKNYQIKKLKNLLINASREISYYRDLFWNIDFDPNKFNSLSDLKKIPILNKSEIINNHASLISGKRIKNAIKLSTSGSTGNRLSIYTSPSQWVIEQAAIWRHWHLAGYKFRDKMAIIRSYNPKKNEKIFKFNKFKNWLYISPYHLDDKHLKEIFILLIKWKPKFLRGYASSIYLLAKYAMKYNIKLNHIEAILTASEKLTSEYRKFIENAFKAKVFDHYGQAEITAMFHEWNDHDGLNNLEYYGHVELIKTNKNNIYKLIATNLHNNVMPLIRYDTGDLVKINKIIKKNEKCNFLKVSEIIGRESDFLKKANGGLIPSTNFYSYFAKIKEIIKFQFITNDNDIKLNLMIDKEAKKKELINLISTDMREKFGKKIIICETNIFNQSAGGKFSAIINKF
jgi:phenylacetate-CoA ligase